MQKMTSTSMHCANLWRGCCPHGGVQCRNASEAAGNDFSLLSSTVNCDLMRMWNDKYRFIVRKIYWWENDKCMLSWIQFCIRCTHGLFPTVFMLLHWSHGDQTLVIYSPVISAERREEWDLQWKRSTLTWQSLSLVIHFSSQIMSSFPFFSPDPLFFLFTRHLLPAPSSPL